MLRIKNLLMMTAAAVLVVAIQIAGLVAVDAYLMTERFDNGGLRRADFVLPAELVEDGPDGIDR